MKHDKLFAKLDCPQLDALLQDWRWLVSGDVSLIQITALGDLILKNADGTVWFLDTIEGKYEQIAVDEAGYQELLGTSQFRQRYLMYYGILNLVNAGIEIGTNQCYSPYVPIHLGGEIDENNMKPADVYVHLSMLGQIWKQTKNLESGKKVDNVQIVSPKKGIISRFLGL